MATKPGLSKDHYPVVAQFRAEMVVDLTTLGMFIATICHLFRSKGWLECIAVIDGVRAKLVEAGRPKEMLDVLDGMKAGLVQTAQDTAALHAKKARQH